MAPRSARGSTTTSSSACECAQLVAARHSYGAGHRYPFVIESVGAVAGTLDLLVALGRDHVEGRDLVEVLFAVRRRRSSR